MTRLYEDVTPDFIDHPERKGLRNFTWTNEAINDWEEIWHQLWRFGYKWEWQNADRYARRRGDIFNLFAVHNDAVRLDMAIPLPGVEVIVDLQKSVCNGNGGEAASDVSHKLSHWLENHYKG